MLPADQVHHVPTTYSLLLRVLAYSASVLIPALGGFHGYRRYYGPFGREAAEAERLRDELVFGDDGDKLGLADTPMDLSDFSNSSTGLRSLPHRPHKK